MLNGYEDITAAVAEATAGKSETEATAARKAARSLAREQRAALKAEGTARDSRLIFAKNQTEAEKLLKAPRDERVVGED